MVILTPPPAGPAPRQASTRDSELCLPLDLPPSVSRPREPLRDHREAVLRPHVREPSASLQRWPGLCATRCPGLQEWPRDRTAEARWPVPDAGPRTEDKDAWSALSAWLRDTEKGAGSWGRVRVTSTWGPCAGSCGLEAKWGGAGERDPRSRRAGARTGATLPGRGAAGVHVGGVR